MKYMEFLRFISPSGLEMFVQLIERAHQERGRGWIESLKEEYPMAQWIFKLVLEMDAEAAYQEVRKAYPSLPVYLCQTQIKNFHGQLLAEIDKRRF